MPEDDRTEASEVRPCRKCGTPLAPRAAICPSCGEAAPGHSPLPPGMRFEGPALPDPDVLARVRARELAAAGPPTTATLPPGVLVALGIATLCLLFALMSDGTASYTWASICGSAVGWLLMRSAILSALRQWRREGEKE